MENTYTAYNSGDSSSNSRETDFENPSPSWEEQPQPQPQRVKFMVSYKGKIQPRTHDNILSYIGGDTKILFVDRTIKFSSFYSKLVSLTLSDSATTTLTTFTFTCKYQLPGEDLDALISVTNDDDLEHLMHEYDRLFKASLKPVRLRLFLFSPHHASTTGFTSADSEPDKDGPGVEPVHNNVDFLFGLDNNPVHSPVETVSELDLVNELNRLNISALEFQQQQQESPEIFENFTNIPANFQPPVQNPAGFWRPIEHQFQNHQLTPQQAVYMMHAPPTQGGLYHAPPVMQPYMIQPVHSTPPPPPAVQVVYDRVTGRHVYYDAAAHGRVTAAPFPGMAAKVVVGGCVEMRSSGDVNVVRQVNTSVGGL